MRIRATKKRIEANKKRIQNGFNLKIQNAENKPRVLKEIYTYFEKRKIVS